MSEPLAHGLLFSRIMTHHRYESVLENQRTLPANLRRIVVPVDFSDRSLAALHWAIEVASHTYAGALEQTRPEIEVLHVWDAPPYTGMAPVPSGEDRDGEGVHTGETFAQRVQELAAERLEALIASVDARGLRIHGRLVSGDVATVLAEAAQTADLLVVGGDDESALHGLFFGKQVRRAADEARCPVISLRVRDDER